ncbi:hypothetical protein FGADI_2337 [Fusarium gaditjirri]|uniref:Uncharacterized protein n=1 Tax=Fusarium gaditjirri TaxID=282569 RepID=A0A8H4TII8_9HYPO|nr:hypothetical protein FGADI_2337 [Fusarium gaditjirri]
MSAHHSNQQQGLSRGEQRAPNSTPLNATDRLKLQELEIAFAKAKRELEVFCMEKDQTSSLLSGDSSEDNGQDHHGPDNIPDNYCPNCGNPHKSAPVAENKYRPPITGGVCCVITRVMNAQGESQVRYTNTTTGGRDDGEWYVFNREGGCMGTQISGSIERLADRVREESGCQRVFWSLYPDCPEEFNRILENHTQLKRSKNSGHDLETGEPVL